MCLVGPPECRESYEILGEPDQEGEPYKRLVRLDAIGTAHVVAYAREHGSGCTGCVGDQAQGLRATVMGKLVEGSTSVTEPDGTPPLLMVTAIMDSEDGCPTDSAPDDGDAILTDPNDV